MNEPNHFQFDIISVGDPTLDTFLKIEEAGLLYNVSQDYSYICMSYKDTIPVAEVSHTVAGNAANNAVGSSRLGLKVSYYGEVGDDPTGHKIHEKLDSEGVDCSYLSMKEGINSNYTVVINYLTERTQLIYKFDRDYKVPKFDKARWLYLSAMGKTKEKFYKDLHKYIVDNDVQFGFNPGVGQIRDGLDVIGDLLKVTKVLILNKEETRALFQLRGSRTKDYRDEIKEHLYAAWDYGPDIVVITDGSKGAYAFNGIDYFHIPIRRVRVVERTGAGDAFSTGLIAAMVYKKDISDALVWGSLNGSSVIQKIGPQEGLLSIGQMRRLCNKYKRYRAVKI